jgi:hypothetical protein
MGYQSTDYNLLTTKTIDYQKIEVYGSCAGKGIGSKVIQRYGSSGERYS